MEKWSEMPSQESGEGSIEVIEGSREELEKINDEMPETMETPEDIDNVKEKVAQSLDALNAASEEVPADKREGLSRIARGLEMAKNSLTKLGRMAKELNENTPQSVKAGALIIGATVAMGAAPAYGQEMHDLADQLVNNIRNLQGAGYQILKMLPIAAGLAAGSKAGFMGAAGGAAGGIMVYRAMP